MRLLSAILCFTALALITSTAHASTWTILPDSTGDAPTIQAGIDSAIAGDTVLVASGTYFEHDINMKTGVVLRSATGDPSLTTIDAQQLGRGLICIQLDSTSRIEGLTFRGGTALIAPDTVGGALFFTSSSIPIKKLRVSDCRFTESTALDGGGIAIRGGLPLIQGCVIDSNTAQNRGGGVYSLYGAPSFSNCSVLWNTANDGGGAYLDQTTGTVTSSLFLHNMATDQGGGLWVQGGIFPPLFRSCRLDSNTAKTGGAGFFFRSSNVVACTLSYNQATGVGFAGGGGGLFLHTFDGVVDSCLFTGNDATDGGGGIYGFASNADVMRSQFIANTAAWGGALDVIFTGGFDIDSCYFLNNTATTGGGAIDSEFNAGSTNITSCQFEGNTALGFGGGVLSFQALLLVDSTLFIGNSALVGAAIDHDFVGASSFAGRWGGELTPSLPEKMPAASAIMRNLTVVDNTSPSGSALFFDGVSVDLENCLVAFNSDTLGPVQCDNGATVAISCTDMYGNSGGDWVGCIAGYDTLNGNFSLDPLFCDTASGDFTLDAISPCLSAPTCGLVGAFELGCDVVTSVASGGNPIPEKFHLAQNWPNPFNPTTQISFTIPTASEVLLTIHSIGGQRVATLVDGPQLAGEFTYTWNGMDEAGRGVSSGVYFASLKAGNYSAARKMLLLR